MIVPNTNLLINENLINHTDATYYTGGSIGKNENDLLDEPSTLEAKSLVNYSILSMVIDKHIKNAILDIEALKIFNKNILDSNKIDTLANRQFRESITKINNIPIGSLMHFIYIVHDYDYCLFMTNNKYRAEHKDSVDDIVETLGDFVWNAIDCIIYFMERCKYKSKEIGFIISKDDILNYLERYSGHKNNDWCDIFLEKYWCIIIDEAHQNENWNITNLMYYCKQLYEKNQKIKIKKYIIENKLETLLNDEPSNPFAKKFLRKFKLLSIDSNCKKLITNIFTKVQRLQNLSIINLNYVYR